MANKDQGLKVDLTGGLLTISIGVSALCGALKGGPAFDVFTDGKADAEGVDITDEDLFAREVVAELEREEEDGSNRIHRMFDAAAQEAVEQGADGVRFPGDKP